MLYRFVSIALLSILCLSLKAQQDNMFEKANDYYKNAEYDKAIDIYEALLTDSRSDVLYYNLANAYYRNGEMALSILNYERALKLSPGDKEILHNLQVVRKQTPNDLELVPEIALITSMKRFISILSADQWAYLSTISLLILLGLILILRIRKRKRGSWPSIAMAGLLFLFAFSTILMWFALDIRNNNDFALIMVDQVTVRSAPDQDAAARFNLYAGAKVEMMDSVENWIKIKIDDSLQGWVKLEDIQSI